MTIAKGLFRVLPTLPNCSTLKCRSLAHMHVPMYAEHVGDALQRLGRLHWITTKSVADSRLPKADTPPEATQEVLNRHPLTIVQTCK
jgi:hypothetical protein